MNSIKHLFSSFKNKTGSFNAKLFFLLTFLIIITYISFAVFFISFQRNEMKSNLLQQGELLSRLLAYNARLGVFTENEDLLEDPINGIMHHKEVTFIHVFTEDGRQLNKHEGIKNRINTITSKNLRAELKAATRITRISGTPYFIEGKDEIRFWAPVFSKSVFNEENVFFEDNASLIKENIIGFVRIVFTTKSMNKELKALLLKSIILPFFFIIPFWIIIYFLVKGVTRPLKKLTEGVVAVGKGSSVKLVNATTKDEIGKLTHAFNNMVISLRTKEAEKKHIEEQLRQSQKMEAIGTLAGGIAHDFNNILSVIIGYVNLLQRKNDFKGSSEQYINNLLSTAERASSLIKSLLAFSRPQSVELRPISINSIFRNLEDNLLRLLGEDIEYTIEIQDKELTVMSDTGQIEQLLVNLAINARDAMPDGGTLTISAKSTDITDQLITFSGYMTPGRYVVISVTDTGTGINKKTREKMFEPFFTTKEVGKGTGLGLSMVYGIIKHHNGFIDVLSSPGHGTTFKFYLQFIEPVITSEKPGQTSTIQGGTETILMAEDNDDVRTLTTRILQQSGYAVIEALDGKDAVDKFIENKDIIDFLLLDIRMPKKNGLDAYKEIRVIRPDIKALFVSGHYDDILEFKQTPSDDSHCSENYINILTKPLSPDTLIKKIRELLDKQTPDP